MSFRKPAAQQAEFSISHERQRKNESIFESESGVKAGKVFKLQHEASKQVNSLTRDDHVLYIF